MRASAKPPQVISSLCYAGVFHTLESHRLKRLETGTLALGCPLNATQLEMFEVYRAELLDWNRRTNLTAITDPIEIEVRHFLDSLTVAAQLSAMNTGVEPVALLDIGAGAGFPGLPLKIALPNLRVWLLESTGKKVAFLQHIVDVLGLNHVTVLQGRAEELGHAPALREFFDVTVARAVGPLAVLAELCLPFTNVNGHFIAMKKGDVGDEISAATGAIEALGGSIARVSPVRIEGLDDDRCLVVVGKVRPTPARFPRRSGMPAKRPLD